MKQILVLAPFQYIVSDFFTIAGKNFDTGAKHFLVKMAFTWCDTDSFIQNSVSAAKNCN